MTDSAIETLAVRTIAGSRSWSLTPDVVTLPATTVIVEVTGHHSQSVTLDGERQRLTPGRAGLLSLDLARSTGYHRLVVDQRPFWFATEDAKLKLSGIEEMLEYLQTSGTGWTGQAIFSDGTGLRDTHVVYAWLDQWADQAIQAIEEVLSNPRFGTTNSTKLSRRGGAGVLKARSIQLLKGSPREYLSPAVDGIFEIEGARYNPLRVVARERRKTLDTAAHRRILGLVRQMAALSAEVMRDAVSTSVRSRCRTWLSRLELIQSRPITSAIHMTPGATAAPRQQEELIDSRYRLCYEIAVDLHRQLAWSAQRAPLSRYSYIQRSDSIYQSFAASAIAAAFGLRQTSPVLGEQSPAFTGDDFDLYFDKSPPQEVLKSWRFGTSHPDQSRPDLILHERATGHVAVLDAKYRIGPGGEASEDSRKEVSAYMALYGLGAVSILYPGAANEPLSIAALGNQILEIPVRPGPALADSLAGAAPAIRATLQAPPY